MVVIMKRLPTVLIHQNTCRNSKKLGMPLTLIMLEKSIKLHRVIYSMML